MKILTVLIFVWATIAYADSNNIVNFDNRTSTLSSPPDRLIRYSTAVANDPGINPFGTNSAPVVNLGSHSYVAQLYFGSTTDGEGSLQAVTNSPALFRLSTTSNPGAWLPGDRMLGNFVRGQTVNLQVRVWEPAFGTDYYSATEGLRGKSLIFQYYMDPNPLAPPSALCMVNFQGFTIGYNVGIPTNASATVSSPAFSTDGQFQFTINGAEGFDYSIQVSTNLTEGVWTSIFTNSSPFSFTDSVSVLYTQRFYRAVFLE